MKKLIFSLLLLPIISIAQDRSGGISNNILANNLGDFAMQKIDKVYHNEYGDKISGSTYLFKDWTNAIVTTNTNNNNHKEYTFSIPSNYNLQLDRFEMKIDNDIYFLEKGMIKEIRIGSRLFKPSPTNYDEAIKSYMEILGEGEELNLIQIHSLKIREVQSKTSLGLYEKKVTVQDNRYFLDKEGKFQEVPSSKKKIYEILELSKEEKDAISGNIKKTESLIQAL